MGSAPFGPPHNVADLEVLKARGEILWAMELQDRKPIRAHQVIQISKLDNGQPVSFVAACDREFSVHLTGCWSTKAGDVPLSGPNDICCVVAPPPVAQDGEWYTSNPRASDADIALEVYRRARAAGKNRKGAAYAVWMTALRLCGQRPLCTCGRRSDMRVSSIKLHQPDCEWRRSFGSGNDQPQL